MKKQWSKYFLALAVLCAASVTASEDDAAVRPVGTRKATQNEKMQSQQQRALFSKAYPDALTEQEEHSYFEEAQKLTVNEVQQKAAENEALEKSVDEDVLQPKNLINTSHAGAYHNPRFITPFGDAIVLEDDSKWSVRGSDRNKILNWYTNDRLVITPNHDWFSSYDYRINNTTTNQAVRVNLVEAPSYNGLFTHWIVALDYVHKKVCLEDGTIWSVSTWDGAELNRMALEDTVIIGTNDSWFKSSRPNILINVDTMEFVKARCDE